MCYSTQTVNMSKLAFCITGWHYGDRETYKKLSLIEDASLFVVSHKKTNQIPEWLYSYVKPENVLVQPNFGYDWGCYQQFLKWGKWQDFDYIFFMHDDIEIKDISFVEACLKRFEQYPVIGNGRVTEPRNWADQTPQCYAHSHWKPAIRDFTHDVVRGSFFATTRQALEAIGDFEIFWDPFHLTVGFGNWSLRATCGKWQSVFGDRDCFSFLSETYCESQWISELYRGGTENNQSSASDPQSPKKSLKTLLTRWVLGISTLHVETYWDRNPTRSLLLALTGILVAIFSGNRGKFTTY